MSLRSRMGRRRAATTASGSGGVDLISRLSNDLLVRILELLPDARDVVRTGALSRRWRGVWTGVGALRFDNGRRRPGADDERYLSFVNDVLALCAATANEPPSPLVGVEDMAISFDISSHETGWLVPRSVEAAQGWIRYAVQQGVKSFVLNLKLPWRWLWNVNRKIRGDDDNNNIEYPVLILDETDSYGKLETLHLRLGRAELRLPSSGLAFESLTKLSLEDIKLPADGCYHLSRLVSSACCPRLQKLRLASFKLCTHTKEKLFIEAAALLELWLEGFGAHFLELETPSLCVLHIENCIKLKVFTISAPRLEDLMLYVRPLHINDVHGHLSSVRTLKIQLFSRGTTSYDRNAGSIHLLQCCMLTRWLEVSFRVTEETKYKTVDRIKGRIPPLLNVTYLSVHIELRERHSSGPGIASLLEQCSNVKYLSLQLRYCILSKKDHTLDLLCDYNCHWKSNDFSLALLEEVQFKNLIGTNCEFHFIQSILTGAIGIQKVTISFDRYYCGKGSMHAFNVMPPLDGGSWTTCIDTSSSYKRRSEDLVYKWTRE